MVLAVGCVHPEGESEEYDGLYYRQNEMQTLANDLVGLPIYVEHMEDQKVGDVVHAWVGDDKRCYTMLETSGDDFPGILAGRMLHHGLCGDLSLGHTCKVDNSANRVVEKTPTEVSICEKGAREKTHIYGVDGPQKTNRRYINNYKLSVSSETDKTMATDAPTAHVTEAKSTIAEATKPTTSDQNTMMSQLLEQVKKLTEQNAKQKANAKVQQEKYSKYEEQMAKEQELGKRKREQAVDGSIKDYFKRLIDKYQKELAPYEPELNQMVEGMKTNAAATPMVEALACCAAMSASSVTELEAAYQENKRLKTELEKNQTELKATLEPHFSQQNQRVQEVKAVASGNTDSSNYASIFSSNPAPKYGRASGMRETNPQMWTDLLSSAPKTSGMPTVEDFIGLKNKK
tara:strand:- start:15016 stop:16221 length:1206 start_codon:yes stop_codon:yes gene_type:complete